MQASQPSTYVLVHGSWHHGGLWDRVKKYLRRYRVDVHTPTVAGHGPGADPNVTHADAVNSIVDYIEEHDLSNIVLLGHSFGGTILTQAAPQLADRITRLVFHNAFVLEDGHSINDEIPPEYVALFDAIKDPETGTIMLPFPSWRDNFIQDVDHCEARETYDLLSPEPGSMFDTLLDQKPFFDLVASQSIGMTYLNAVSDIALPHGEYAWHPRFYNRLGFPRLVQMDGSHEVMFSDPRGLADAIIQAGRN